MPSNTGDAGEQDEWLSLQAASARLGVPTSTLRRWGDEGRVPMKRTLGGHRRFARTAITRLAERPTQAVVIVNPPPVQAWGVDEREMSRQDWHSRFVSHGGSAQMRGLGQRMLGLLMQYINRRDDDSRFLAEAGGVGAAYGKQARGSGISLHDTVEAFLFFRGSFARLALPLPGMAQPPDLDASAQLHKRIDQFMDAVLLGLIEGYESADA